MEQRVAVVHHRAKAAVLRQQRIDVDFDRQLGRAAQFDRDEVERAQVVVDDRVAGQGDDVALDRPP
jgi:hypothetical protein